MVSNLNLNLEQIYAALKDVVHNHAIEAGSDMWFLDHCCKKKSMGCSIK